MERADDGHGGLRVNRVLTTGDRVAERMRIESDKFGAKLNTNGSTNSRLRSVIARPGGQSARQ